MRICSRRPVGTVASALHYTLTAPLEYDMTPPDKLVDARRRSPGPRKPPPPKKKNNDNNCQPPHRHHHTLIHPVSHYITITPLSRSLSFTHSFSRVLTFFFIIVGERERRYRLGRLKVSKMCALTMINPHCCVRTTLQNEGDKTTVRLY